MRDICAVVLIIGCVVSVHATGYSAPSRLAPQESSPGSSAIAVSDHPRDVIRTRPADNGTPPRKLSDEDRGRHPVSAGNYSRSHISLSGLNHPE
jgi:hypothetical protein